MRNAYTLKNIKKIKWGVLEENQPISLYPCMYPGWCSIIEVTGKILGRPQKSIVNLNRKDKGSIFVDHKEWTGLGRHALKKIVSDPKWGLWLNKKILQLSDELVKFTSAIFRTNLKTKTSTELYRLYEKYLNKHSNLYNYAIIPVYLDLYKPHLTNFLVQYLEKQVGQAGFHKTGKECFALLTIPEKLSKVQEEEIALLRLAATRSKNIDAHTNKFRYLGYNFEGLPFPDSYFSRRLKKMTRDSIRPRAKIKLVQREKRTSSKIHDQLAWDLAIDKKHMMLLDVTRGFIYSKDYRKMSLVQSYYETEALLRELAKRCKLSLAEFRNCLLPEVKDMILGKLKRPKDLTRRMLGCLFVVVDEKLPGRVYVDERFKTLAKYLLKKEDFKEINYLHGQPACLGKARGRVKIINSARDLKKCEEGIF